MHASPAKAAHAAALEHLARVDEVLAAVVALPLLRIAEGLVRLADLLEAVGRFRAVGVLVRVVHDGELAVGLLDLGLARVLVEAEDLVVVLALGLLELELRVADVLGDARLRGVRFRDRFEFPHRIVPVPRLAEGTRLCFARFGVSRVERQSSCTVVDCGLVLLDLRKCQHLDRK